MRARAAHVQPFDWRTVASKTATRASREHLLRCDVKVADVAVCQPYTLLKFNGREKFPVEHHIAEVRCVLRYRVDQVLTYSLLRVLPCTFAQLYGRIH